MDRSLTDAEILDALRSAAIDGRPLSTAGYERHRATSGGPSVAWIIRRFGSWRDACARAGLAVNVASARKATWTEDELVAHVAAYLTRLAEDSGSGAPSYAGYSAWAKGRPATPSGATIRARMSWSDALSRARG